MRSYTSKGRQADVRPEFELDGETFRGEGTISLMDLSEFARLAAEGFDDGSPEGIAILADIYRELLGTQEYTRFRRHCREHGTDGRLLLEIIGGILAEAGDRPTERSSGSPDGPPTTEGTSTVVSFSRGTVEQAQTPPETQKPEETEPQLISYG
jgi:hypothetical protein